MKIKTMYKLGGVIIGIAMLLNFGAYVDAEFNGVLTAENLEKVCDITSDEENGLYIDCENAGITEISKGMFDNYLDVNIINFYDNGILSIEKGIFSGLSNLDGLDLGDNQISSIEEGSFEDLNNLKILYLDGNQLSLITRGIFSGLESLEMLDLWGNPLKSIDLGYFDDISHYPKIEGMVPELTSENIKDICSINILGGETEDGSDGSVIMDCSGRGIMKIAVGVFNDYGNVQELNLSNNMLTNIEKGVFSGLNSLEYLDLSGNPLESVDYSDFDDMENKPVIWDGTLTANNIEEICEISTMGDKKAMTCRGITRIASGAFADYEDVREIAFSESYISNLDASLFEGLDELELIVMDNTYKFDTSNLEDNGIDVFWLGRRFNGELNAFNLEDGICDINHSNDADNSVSIDCSGAEIISIKKGTFKLLSTLMSAEMGTEMNVKELYLNDNQITKVEKGTFEGLDSLEYLDLRGNPLESVDYSDFEDMDIEPIIMDGLLTKDNVERYCQFDVYMGKNTIMCMGITSVASGSFDDYEDVQMIGFVGGYLKSLDASLFEGLDDLEFIMVQDNYYELDLSGIEEKGIVVFTGELNDRNVNYVCDSENGFINCNGRGITRVASGVFLGLLPTLQSPATIIHLDNNDIETLEDGAFEGINAGIPTYIDLQNNEIDEINLGAFDGINGGFNVGEYQFGDNTLEGWVNVGYLNGLEEGEEFDMTEYYGFDRYVAIDLGNNEIEEIEEGSFNGLSNLQSINLGSNNLSELDESVFEGLENLQELNIGDNSFECVPEWVYNSDMNIEYDDLKVCGLLDYETIQGLCNLSEDRETLDCSDKGITYLDSSAFDYDVLQGVKNVILSGNRISELNGEEFENLPSLEYANLRGNPLYCYPNLNEWLEEGDERDIELEADEGVPMCKELNAENMMKLCDIILPGYLLEQYGPSEDVTYDENSNDFVIDCSNRGITSIAPYTFENLNMDGESNYIYLNRNLIKELKSGIFSNLHMNGYKNNYVYLNNNKIDKVRVGSNQMTEATQMASAFDGLSMEAQGSNYIYLDNNELESIGSGVFKGLGMMAPSNHIYLNNNEISMIDDYVFSDISMTSNSWCDVGGGISGGGGSDTR